MGKTIAITLMSILVITVGLFNPPPLWAPVIEFAIDKDHGPPISPEYYIFTGNTDLKSANVAAPLAKFFEHTDFKGRSFILYPNHAEKNLKKTSYPGFRKNWNDRISSIELGGCTTAIYWEHSDYNGTSYIFKNKEPFKAMIKKLPSGWNDRISSISVKNNTPCHNYK